MNMSGRMERRTGQRFELHLPLTVHFGGRMVQGFTQDLSGARDVLLCGAGAGSRFRLGIDVLKERGYPEEVRRAILSHAEYTGVARTTPMEKTLFACDELAGFITACALVKPGKSLAEVEAKSVRKKMKDRAFARSVNREDIVKGAADLGADLEQHIAFCIEAMKGIAKELGLDGTEKSGVV